MKVLVTGVASDLGRVIAEGLAEQHEVTTIDSSDGLGHDSSTNDLVRRVDVMWHWGVWRGARGEGVFHWERVTVGSSS